MLRGYRLLVLAFGLILCGAQPPKEQAQGKASTQPTEQAVTEPYAPYTGYNPAPCYQAKNHDAADLCAQWRASIAAEKAAHEARRATSWSIVATLLSVIGLGAILWSLRQTERSLGQARIANQIALDASKQELRAYVGFCGWKATTRNGILTFEVTIKNFGQTPALNLQVERFVTRDAQMGHKDMTFIEVAAIDLHPGNDWKSLKAVLEGVTPRIELHYFAEVRYSDIFGRRWALPVRFYRNTKGQWYTVPDEDGSNREYEITDQSAHS